MYFIMRKQMQPMIFMIMAVVLLGQKMNIRTRASLVKMIDHGSQVLLSTLDFQEGESVLDVGWPMVNRPLSI